MLVVLRVLKIHFVFNYIHQPVCLPAS